MSRNESIFGEIYTKWHARQCWSTGTKGEKIVCWKASPETCQPASDAINLWSLRMCVWAPPPKPPSSGLLHFWCLREILNLFFLLFPHLKAKKCLRPSRAVTLLNSKSHFITNNARVFFEKWKFIGFMTIWWWY